MVEVYLIAVLSVMARPSNQYALSTYQIDGFGFDPEVK